VAISEKMRKKFQKDLEHLTAEEMAKILKVFIQENKRRKKKKK